MFDPTLRIPYGYSRGYKTLAEVETWLLVHYHPEYIRRLLAWLSSRRGLVGIGGTWRADGTQPDKPGFAAEGKSFHQNQQYADGFIGACAVDLVCPNGAGVHRAPTWDEVPRQGGFTASLWGVHCNIDTEPWHMQPIEVDGWQSWINAGSPAPRPNYPLPGGPPAPIPPPVSKEIIVSADGYIYAAKRSANGSWWVGDGRTRIHTGGKAGRLRAAAGVVDVASEKLVHSFDAVAAVDDVTLTKYVGEWDGATTEAE